MARASVEPGIAQVFGITMDPAGGTIDVVSKRRAGLLAGEVIDIATHTHNGARYSSSQMETLGWSRIARHYSGTAAPTNPLWHASQALDAMRDASVWYAGEACGERLYAAIPEPRRGAALVTRGFEKGIAAGLFAFEDARLMTRLMHATHQVRLLAWLADGMRVAPAEVIRRMQRELVCMFCQPEQIAELLRERGLLERAEDPSVVAE